MSVRARHMDERDSWGKELRCLVHLHVPPLPHTHPNQTQHHLQCIHFHFLPAATPCLGGESAQSLIPTPIKSERSRCRRADGAQTSPP